MRARRILDDDVSAVGFGAMHLSLENRPSYDDARRTLRAVLDAGCTLLDTADAYCVDGAETGHNERLVADAIRTWGGRDQVCVVTKGGHLRPGDGSWQLDGRPESLRRACEQSLRSLGTDVIDVYLFHRPDPQVPYAESIGALRDLLDEGKVRAVGVSNANVAQLDEAHSIVPLACVENEYSPWFLSSTEELQWCTERNIAFLAWAPLGGTGRAGELGSALPSLGIAARDAGMSPAQVLLAWELAQSPVLIPIPGARRVASALDSLGAADRTLDPAVLAQLDREILGRSTAHAPTTTTPAT